jgi:hypothetical protein
MEAAGQSPELATGTKLFCKPDCYLAMRKSIQRLEASLRPYHVIVTAEFRPLVMEVVKNFPRALKVKCKEETVIARVGLSGKWIQVHQGTIATAENESKSASTPVKEQMPKNSKAKAEVDADTGFIGIGLADQSLALESFLNTFPVPAVDPALAFPIFNPFPALPEVDPAVVMRLMQEMEHHQQMLNGALLLSAQANQIAPDFALIAALQR